MKDEERFDYYPYLQTNNAEFMRLEIDDELELVRPL